MRPYESRHLTVNCPDTTGLRARFRQIYWIGGGSGAGKSTIARRIAAQHDLRLYATDDVMADHAGRSTPEDYHSSASSLLWTWTSDGSTDRRKPCLRHSIGSAAKASVSSSKTFSAFLATPGSWSKASACYRQATGLGLPIIEVDTTVSEDQLAERVTELFGL